MSHAIGGALWWCDTHIHVTHTFMWHTHSLKWLNIWVMSHTYSYEWVMSPTCSYVSYEWVMSHTCSYFSRCKHLVISSLPIVAMLIGGVTAALLGDALQVLQRVLQCVAVYRSDAYWWCDRRFTRRCTSGVAACVAVCCSVLHRVAVCCIALHCVALCCIVLRCNAVCCSVVQCVAACCSELQHIAPCCTVSLWVAVFCNVLQCAAVCCSTLQCVAICCAMIGSVM